MSRGGPRSGAGRPPLARPSRRVCARLTAEELDYLATIDPQVSCALHRVIADHMISDAIATRSHPESQRKEP